MGFSIKDYMEKFSDMNKDLRTVVYDRLVDTGISFGLSDLTVSCFTRRFGLQYFFPNTSSVLNCT